MAGVEVGRSAAGLSANRWRALTKLGQAILAGWLSIEVEIIVMKTLWLVIVLAVAGVISLTLAQPERKPTTKEFMAEKLVLSQVLLRGLALEEFELLRANAAQLSAMSKQADWRVFQNPDYDHQSTIFQRHANALVRAAESKDIDGATLAYLRLTLSCVDCHKLVRGKLVAAAEGQTELRFY